MPRMHDPPHLGEIIQGTAGNRKGDALCEPGCVLRLWGRARGRSQFMHPNRVTPSATPP
jgi:hypothetical protein